MERRLSHASIDVFHRIAYAAPTMDTAIPYIDGRRVTDALPYAELSDALRTAFREPATVPQRHAHALPGQGSLLLMPAWQPGGRLGVKLVTVVPDNRERGLPSVHALYVLMDASSGAPLALLDGEALTLRRTAAVSALASSMLSRPDSRTLLVVGNGRLAPEMAVAHCSVRDIRQVLVWGRDAARVGDAMRRMRDAGLPQRVALAASALLPQACAQADIICCATTSDTPLLQAGFIRPGTHVDLVGGFRPQMREADDALMCSASLFVDTDCALAEAGDLVQPMQAGLLGREAVLSDLSGLVRGIHPGRRSDDEVTLFKSVGTALADLASAGLVWSRRAASAHG